MRLPRFDVKTVRPEDIGKLNTSYEVRDEVNLVLALSNDPVLLKVGDMLWFIGEDYGCSFYYLADGRVGRLYGRADELQDDGMIFCTQHWVPPPVNPDGDAMERLACR